MDQSLPQESRRVMDDEIISRLRTDGVVGSLREMTLEQAARRVGQEFGFGPPVVLQGSHSHPALHFVGWLLGLVAAFGIFLAGVDSNWGPSRPVVLACLPVVLLVGFFMVVVGTKRGVLNGWLARYRYGYVQMLASDGRLRAVRWASVTEVTVSYNTTIVATGWPAGASVKNVSVDSFSARPFIGRLAPKAAGVGLMRDALRAVGPRLVTAMIKACESGRPVTFGSVRIDQHGVASPSRHWAVSWADIHAIRMRNVRLGSGVRVVRESTSAATGRRVTRRS
jgi:hypothetical protein